jgi:predicted dehydrogenase
MADGVSGTIQVSRAAWGRKGRLQLQIFGAQGAIVFDQERFNEVGLFVANGPEEAQGFKQILMGPAHPPYGRFIAGPGHQLGFNDLKTIEAHELLNRILGRPGLVIDFEAGLAIERTIHAIARSSREGRWVGVG